MIYRILDTETKQYVTDIFVDPFGFLHKKHCDNCWVYEPVCSARYKIEWGFNYNKKCYYENDIIEIIDEYKNKTKHVIINKTHEGYPAFELEPLFSNVYNSFSIILFDYDYKVIGNVNQNPELMDTTNEENQKCTSKRFFNYNN